MSIADKITSMTNHLEKDYQALESVVGTVSVNKNIENIAPLLDNLWEDLPKTTGSGTSPSISGTRAGKMKVNLLGNTSQDSTTGKNIANVTSVNANLSKSGDVITLASGSTGSNFIDFEGKTLEANVEYVLEMFIVGTTTNNVASELVFRDSDNNIIFDYSLILNTNRSKSFTPTSAITISRLNIYNSSNPESSTPPTTGAVSFKIQIRKSSTASGYEPYTNGASPNPSYPQQVHIVDGDNTIKTIGKNLMNTDVLFDEMYELASASVKPTKTIEDNKNCILFFNNQYYNKVLYDIGYKENTPYTLRFMARVFDTTITSSYKLYLVLNYTDGTTQNVSHDANGSNWIEFRIVSSSSKTLESISFSYGGQAKWLIDTDSFNIIEGDTTSYEPYQSSTYPIHLGTYELCKISTYQDKFIRNSGKNIWDEDWEVGAYAWATGEKVANNQTIRSKNKMPIKPSTTYYVTIPSEIVIEFFDSTDTFLGTSTNVNKNSSASFTTPSNASYFVLYMTNAYGTTYKNDIMINEGSTALPYEPYGDGEWYLEKKIGKVVLDGSQTLNLRNTSANNTYTYSMNAPFNYKIEQNASVFSDYFVSLNTVDGVSNMYDAQHYLDILGIALYYNSNSPSISSVYINSNVELPNWLPNNNVSIYYVLSSPTYTKITDNTLLTQLENVWRANSYKGQTNISQVNNDLPFELSYTALEG